MGRAGIETRAGGQLFRSRLEARWATFFDLIGWRWTYEPFDADGYIPDFLIHGEQPLLVEVKPHATLAAAQEEIDRIMPKVIRHWEHDVLVVGCDPYFTFTPEYGEHGYGYGPLYGRCAGLLSCADYVSEKTCSADRAIWTDIGGFGVREELMSFHSRPTGDYDGNCDGLTSAGLKQIEHFWREAGNRNQWKPTR